MKIFTITMTPINPPYDDAAKNIVISVARKLKDYQFTFISCLGRHFERLENITYIDSPFQGPGRHRMNPLQKIFVFLAALLNIRRIDLFQFFFTPQPYFSRVFSKLVKKHNKKSIQIVTSIHTLAEKNKESVIPGLFFADYVVAMSDYTKAKLTNLGVNNVVRIYPGIDLNRFRKNYSAGDPDIKEAILDSGFNIVYPGTYSVLKECYSFEDFCKIALDVVAKIKNARFIMACRIRTKKEERLAQDFEKLTEKYNLRSHFRFLKTVNDVPYLFNKSSIGIFPLRQGMVGILEIPLVLLELASLGKPVLYGNTPPLNELFEKGIGLKIEDSSAPAYAKSVIRLAQDQTFAGQIGINSMNAVLEDFSMDSMAASYQKLYENLKL